MRILISNDDGIMAKGIVALAEALLPLGRVSVAAPNRERSACSHSLTLEHPLRATAVHFPVPVHDAWAISGTPSDCVKLAIGQLLREPPDVVVSGINKGANLSVDVFYSGTAAAAMEGAFAGFPSFAFSLASYDPASDFTCAAKWAAASLKHIMERGPEKNIMYNINMPSLPERDVKGVRITRMGHVRYRESFECRRDPNGKPYYWLCGDPEILDQSPECDIVAVREGYVSITPIRAEMTDFGLFQKMSESGFVNGIQRP
ncbi:5'/3'-nucleotidase SurE [Candidatus Ozemobacteraceae bacterium]|nr:5'/3'-nucleotidase SurE [Candidatus Ozemobacteraceae bacterium]